MKKVMIGTVVTVGVVAGISYAIATGTKTTTTNMTGTQYTGTTGTTTGNQKLASGTTGATTGTTTGTTATGTTTGESTMTTAAKTGPEAGKAFLESNKAKTGVITLPDGLQYKVIEEGNGPKPTLADTVTVHYAGTLVDGTEFDSSYKRGQPISFPVTGVIPGWTEALQLMPAGSTWELYIPPHLAYGDRGAPPVIGPNETLIFKVKLISVNQG